MNRIDRNGTVTGSGPAAPLLTVGLSTLSGALEYYDFVIFAFFIKTISVLFFPADMPAWVAQVEAFGIFSAGYIARPLGGIVVAHFGDKLGRKRMFLMTVLLMTVSSLGMAVMPTYADIGIAAPLLLLLLRVLQGAAIGGEVPGAWTFVAEHVAPRRVGFACGVMSGGIALGIFMGSLTAVTVNAWLSPAEIEDYGWRLPFFAGGCAGLISVYLRRYLAETPVFRTLQAHNGLATKTPLGIVLRQHPKSVLLSFVLGWWLAVANFIMFIMTPTLLQTVYNLPAALALPANLASTAGLFVGAVAFGALIDRWGGGRILILGNVLLMPLSYLLFTELGAHPSWLMPLYLLIGLAGGAGIAAVPSLMVVSFPAPVRFTGVSFSYNLAWATLGGLTPVIVTFGLRFDPLAHMHYFLGICVVGIVTGIAVRAGRSRVRWGRLPA